MELRVFTVGFCIWNMIKVFKIELRDGSIVPIHVTGMSVPRAGSTPDRVVDLGGRTVIPGINDAHNHAEA